MKSYVALFAGIGLGIAVASTPLPVRVVSLAAAQDAGHEQHQQGAGAAAPGGKMKMGNMMASEAKLEELVKKMNDAKGEANKDRRNCRGRDGARGTASNHARHDGRNTPRSGREVTDR